MKKDAREHYLNLVWRPYPAAPEGAISIARALALDVKGMWQGGQVVEVLATGLLLESQGHQRFFEAGSSDALVEGEFDWRVILRPGDKIVARHVDGYLQVQLLAPAVAERPRSPLTTERAKQWQHFLRRVRDHLGSRGFVEVSTPSLVLNPGYEPTLEPFAVELRRGRTRRTLFLPTSPELSLKKLLAQGWSEIFEIRSCFRNDEFTDHHQPEFTMLEWYRGYCGLSELAEDLRALIQGLASEKNANVCAAEQASSPKLIFREMTVAEVFKQVLGFRLTPVTKAEELARELSRREAAKGVALPTLENESWNDLYHRLWVEWIDPWLAQQPEALLISGFPPAQAALARVGADGWAERLELYWKGFEIANGFHELNHPGQQRERAAFDLRERSRLGRTEIPNDEEFLGALDCGMAPGVGIAVGLERLFMALHNVRDIRHLKTFPYE